MIMIMKHISVKEKMIGIIRIKYRLDRRFHPSQMYTFRLYCTYYTSLDEDVSQLTSDIELIYNKDRYAWLYRGVFPNRIREINHLLENEQYMFSPINCYILKKSAISSPLLDLLYFEHRNGYLGVHESPDNDTLSVCKAGSPSDLLLFFGLSKRLLKSINFDADADAWKMDDLENIHYQYIDSWDSVRRLYRIDLIKSINNVDKISVMNALKDIGYINPSELELINRLIKLPTISGDDFLETPRHGIPSIGEITNVIFHIFLIYQLDDAIEYRYRRITYSRWGTELIIGIKNEDPFELNAHKLLDTLHLYGDIDYIDAGHHDYLVCGPNCYRKILTLSEEGIVCTYEPNDF